MLLILPGNEARLGVAISISKKTDTPLLLKGFPEYNGTVSQEEVGYSVEFHRLSPFFRIPSL